MTRYLTALTAIFFFLHTPALFAGHFEYDSSRTGALLWKIEHPDLSAPSYLFGTMHIISEEHYFLPDSLITFLERSEVLALEINMSNPLQMLTAMTGMFMKDGITLKDLYTPEEYEEVMAVLKQKAALPAPMLIRIKPMLISGMLLDPGQGGSSAMKSYEIELMSMARNHNLTMKGLETIQYQLSIFDSIPYSLQAKALLYSLRDLEAEGESLEALIALYTMQDVEQLAGIMPDELGEMEAYIDLFLKDRNMNWIPAIAELISKKPAFIAVGAGHLGGDYGVIQLLRNEGYILTPVP